MHQPLSKLLFVYIVCFAENVFTVINNKAWAGQTWLCHLHIVIDNCFFFLSVLQNIIEREAAPCSMNTVARLYLPCKVVVYYLLEELLIAIHII